MSRNVFLWSAPLLFYFGCGDGTSSSPTPLSPPKATELAVFTDGSGFSTTDVLDSNDEVMRFDTANNTLIWAASNLVFDGWVVNGSFLDEARLYEVRFGTVSGQKRAYFTEVGPGTLCDLQVDANRTLRISPTNLLPPSS